MVNRSSPFSATPNKMSKKPTPTILITIDVEDWFQVENFKVWISPESWPFMQLRVERNTHRLLGLLEGIKSTFFILGWIADRLPRLVREIADRGHEIASHGYGHQLCPDMTPAELKEDLIRSKKLLEDISGTEVVGYRAPSFSISNRVLQILERCGYRYDSSFNSFQANPRYGKLDISRYHQNGRGIKIAPHFHELPLSNLALMNRILPWSGGGYFRLLPYSVFRQGVRSILANQGFYIFYLHPWEIDHRQPRVTAVDPLSRFRHYYNLKSTSKKLSKFLSDHGDYHFSTCRDFLEPAQSVDHAA